MGLFKRLKAVNDVIESASGIVAQAPQLGTQGHQMALARQAAMQAQMRPAQPGWSPTEPFLSAMQPQLSQVGQVGGQLLGRQLGRNAAADPAGFDFGAVAGVSLEEFVAVSKGLAAYNYEQSKLMNVAASYGIDTFTWEQAARGWNDRIRSNPAVAQRFKQLYLAA